MKFIAIASLISTFSAVQISAPGQSFPKWDAAPVFEMQATLSQKTSQLAQANPKPTEEPKPIVLKDGTVLTPMKSAKGGPVKKAIGGGKPEIGGGKPAIGGGKPAKADKKAIGGGAVDKSPEPPLTKVYQEVDMSSKCSKGVCHVKECFDGKCKTYEKKQPPKFEFQQPDSHWKAKVAGAVDPVVAAKAAEKAGKAPGSATSGDAAATPADAAASEEPTLHIPETPTPSSAGGSTATAPPSVPQVIVQNDNLKAINSIIKEVSNRPPTEANKLLLDGIVDDTMIDMDIYSGKKTKEAADILKNKEFAMVKSSEIEQEMVQTNSVLNNIEKLLSKSKK